MKIQNNMSLDQLAERMGWSDEIDWQIVETMRELLVNSYAGQDTSDVPDREWLSLLDRSVSP